MNAQRRKALAKLLETLDNAKVDLEDLAGEEREAFDNMPESLHGSERGEAASNAADALESAMDSLESMVDDLSGIE